MITKTLIIRLENNLKSATYQNNTSHIYLPVYENFYKKQFVSVHYNVNTFCDFKYRIKL